MRETTIQRAVDKYISRRASTGVIATTTAVSQRNVLRAFAHIMGPILVTSVTPLHIERWLATTTGKAASTRAKRFGVIRVFFDDLVLQGLIHKNPCRAMRPPSTPRAVHRALTRPQVAAILRACPDELATCYVLLGFQCGVRRAEVAGLQVGDVSWAGETLLVHGKGGHQRIVPVPAEAMAAVERYVSAAGCSSGPLLRQRRFPDRGVSPDWVGEDFVELAYAAGVKKSARDGVSYHSARHTAATDIYRACKDVVMVRDVLGHASLSTTQTYVAGMDVSGLREAMAGRTYQEAMVDELAAHRRSPSERKAA